MLWSSSRVVFDGALPGTYEIDRGWVRSEGTLITEVGRGAAPAGATDFGDRLISPAFVDPHTHLALVALRGYDPAATGGNVVEDLYYRFESKLNAADIAAFARLGAYEALLNGIGLVWDHYFHAEALADAIAEVGLSAVIAPTIQNLSGPGVPTVEQAFAETEALQDASWRQRGIYACVGPHATDTVDATNWRRCAELARSLDVPMHAHLSQSPEEVERSLARHGKTPLRWLNELDVLADTRAVFAHGLFLDREELKLLDRTHTLIVCPHAQMLFGFPARVDVWSEAQVQWSVATDAAASNDSHNIQKELRLLAGWSALGTSFSETHNDFLGGRGSAQDVWRARNQRRTAEGNAQSLLHRVWGQAGALHPHMRAGTIEPGALANLVVWDTHHPSFWPGNDPLHALVFGDVSGAIHAMQVSGKSIGAAGEFASSLRHSAAYEQTRQDCDQRLQALLAEL